MPKQIQRISKPDEEGRRLAQCPFCKQWLQFQFVGSHWRLTCLNRDCTGWCYIMGYNEEDIINKIVKSDLQPL